MKKAFQFRIYPNKKQEAKLNRTLSTCRHVYNDALAERRLDRSFKNFYNGFGYPRFQGRNRYNTFAYPQSGFELKGGKVNLSKIGSITIIQHREIEGTIKTCTIKKDIDQWYVIFTVDISSPIQPIDPKTSIGVDVGLNSLLTFSNGEQIEPPEFLRKNQRTDFSHKTSRKLVDSFDRIVFENLQIQNMMQNHHLAKSISDAGWNQLISLTKSKAECAGKVVELVNARNTSQNCSGCGNSVPKNLSVRIHSKSVYAAGSFTALA